MWAYHMMRPNLHTSAGLRPGFTDQPRAMSPLTLYMFVRLIEARSTHPFGSRSEILTATAVLTGTALPALPTVGGVTDGYLLFYP